MEGIYSSYTYRNMSNHLTPSIKPKVIVKRSNGEFKMGAFMYAGFLDGTDMAGVQLDISHKLIHVAVCSITHLGVLLNFFSRRGRF